MQDITSQSSLIGLLTISYQKTSRLRFIQNVDFFMDICYLVYSKLGNAKMLISIMIKLREGS